MRVEDWGNISGELLVIGGLYSNLRAFQSFLQIANGASVLCTGDIVAYGAEAAETVAAFRASHIRSIAGNVEMQLAANALDCGCGFDEGTLCDRLSAAWYAHANARIGEEDRQWMVSLPDLATFTFHGRKGVAIHGGVTDVARFLFPTSPESAFEEELAALNTSLGPVDLVLAGHSGVAFHRRIGATDWINAGALGMPPHDGRAETRYARLTPTGVIFERLAYPASEAAAAMQAAGLSQGYDKALLSGYWPSEDVLPPEMRRYSSAKG